jgi:HEAT repeat protein
MKSLYIFIVTIALWGFILTARGKEAVSPVKSLEMFTQELKEKNVDDFIKRIYFPQSEKTPQLTKEMKEQISKQLSSILGCLLNGEIGITKETNDFALITACEILPGNQKSAELKSIFLVRINDNWKISPLFFEPVRLPNMNEEQFNKQVAILKSWFEKQADLHSSKLCSAIKITKKQIPYRKNFSLAPGNAITIILPDGKTLAVWCNKTGAFSLPGDSDLSLSYGEKPFRLLEIKWIPQPDGSRVAGPYKSYIRSGEVTTWSSGPGHEYVLYVGDKYRISLKEEGDKDGKLPIRLSVRDATNEEKVKPENEVDHLVSQLKLKEPVKRIKAIRKLQEALMMGCNYATPRWEYIVQQIKPLSKDNNAAVREQALQTLIVLGDLDSIMSKIIPEPAGKNLNADTALELGQFTKRSKNKNKKQEVYDHVKTFFNSNKPELRAFAVSFFTYSDKLREIRQQLIKAQKDSSPKVRTASILAMEQVYPENEIPKHRIPMLNDESEEVVITVMESSVGYGSERELPISAVEKFINSKNKKIRLAAIDAIQFKDNEQSEAILLPLTYDKDKDIRVSATYALCGEKSAKVYQRFLELLQDNDSLVRIRALQGLYLDDYIEAIPHLKKFIKIEKDKEVQEIAQEAIDKLERIKKKEVSQKSNINNI